MPFDFTMIFEYRLPGSDESALKKWAKRLNALSKLQGEEHLAALETLTRLFTDDPR
jgi:hypothetical protein